MFKSITKQLHIRAYLMTPCPSSAIWCSYAPPEQFLSRPCWSFWWSPCTLRKKGNCIVILYPACLLHGMNSVSRGVCVEGVRVCARLQDSQRLPVLTPVVILSTTPSCSSRKSVISRRSASRSAIIVVDTSSGSRSTTTRSVGGQPSSSVGNNIVGALVLLGDCQRDSSAALSLLLYQSSKKMNMKNTTRISYNVFA